MARKEGRMAEWLGEKKLVRMNFMIPMIFYDTHNNFSDQSDASAVCWPGRMVVAIPNEEAATETEAENESFDNTSSDSAHVLQIPISCG